MSLIDHAKTSTLPKLLQRNAEEDPKGAGIREKTRGVWQTYSWTAYRDNVRDFALGLAALGFRRGDKLSVVGDNRPQLYFAQLSAQALGGISVPVAGCGAADIYAKSRWEPHEYFASRDTQWKATVSVGQFVPPGAPAAEPAAIDKH